MFFFFYLPHYIIREGNRCPSPFPAAIMPTLSLVQMLQLLLMLLVEMRRWAVSSPQMSSFRDQDVIPALEGAGTSSECPSAIFFFLPSSNILHHLFLPPSSAAAPPPDPRPPPPVEGSSGDLVFTSRSCSS